jgi:hypothetical protein
MTGDATTIRLQRERAAVEQLLRYNALNLDALDRYNALSSTLATIAPKGA